MAKYLLTLATLGLLATLGSAISCYYCSGSKCKSNTCTNITAASNGGAVTYDIRLNVPNICLKVLWTKGGESIVDKYCSYDPNGGTEGCTNIAGYGDGTVTSGPIMTVCTCKGNLCNGAQQTTISLIGAIIASFISIFAIFMY